VPCCRTTSSAETNKNGSEQPPLEVEECVHRVNPTGTLLPLQIDGWARGHALSRHIGVNRDAPSL
jgi:hypothetical protein